MKINEKKIAFIMCVNDEQYLEECIFYIQHLTIPEGYEIDTVAVRGATSMTEGYNAAMKSSDAKYKIYMHQDVFLINRNMLCDMIKLFLENPEYGMLGVVGGEMQKAGAFHNNWNVFHTLAATCRNCFELKSEEENKENKEVTAIDGMLMMTQYDVEWREDVFDGWHFYDASQCMEFIKKGYKVVVPYMDSGWAFHDAGYCSHYKYDVFRKKFCKEYKEYGFCYEEDKKEKCDEITENIKVYKKEIACAFENKQFDKVRKFLQQAHDMDGENTWIEDMCIIMELDDLDRQAQKEICFLDNINSVSEALDKYNRVKFLMKRMEFGFDDCEYEALMTMIYKQEISLEAILKMIEYKCVYQRRVWNKITRMQYRDSNKIMQECSFDQFGRYETICRVTHRMKKVIKTDRLKVLEVGANEHRLLEKMLLDENVYFTDLELLEACKYDYHYFASDATDMKQVEDGTYDVVIAADVFEHIPFELREKFISELYRVAKYGVIFCFPFACEHNEKAEWELNEYFKKLTGEGYRWLKEHIENGLPQKRWVENYLEKEHIPYTCFEHSDVELWEKMMKTHLYAAVNEEVAKGNDNMDFLYNKSVYQSDVAEKNYRVFYVLPKEIEHEKIGNLNQLFDKDTENEAKKVICDFADMVCSQITIEGRG